MRDLTVYFEIVAIFLPVVVLGAALAQVGVAFATARPALLVGAASWFVFGLVAVSLPWVPLDTGHPPVGVSIAVSNVLGGNRQPAAAARDLLARHADILVVPEDTAAIHERLSSSYRYARRYETFGSWLGVFSNLPVTELPPLPGVFDPDRYVRIEVETPTPFVLWAVHMPRPWLYPNGTFQRRPGGYARVLSSVLDGVAKERLPVVLAGDLNMTDRGRAYDKATAHLDDAMRSIRGGRSEIKPYFRPLLLSIDRILMPPSWCADRAARFRISGSDHRGITARVGPCVSG